MKYILVVLFLTVYNVTHCQLKIKTDEKITFAEVDNIGNIYVVTKTLLSKYNTSGVFLYNFSNNINGEISSIDVTNPLKILIFYKESNIICFLNQQLAPITNSIDIYDIVNAEATVACSSHEEEFWIYSRETQNVILLNNQFQKIQESQNLNSWIQQSEIHQIKEQNQRLYLTLSNKIIVLDIFGSYIKTLHFKDASQINLNTNNTITYVVDNKIFIYNTLSKTTKEIYSINTNNNLKQILYHNNKIYTVYNKDIVIL